MSSDEQQQRRLQRCFVEERRQLAFQPLLGAGAIDGQGARLRGIAGRHRRDLRVPRRRGRLQQSAHTSRTVAATHRVEQFEPGQISGTAIGMAL
jgi:hypothetical protein